MSRPYPLMLVLAGRRAVVVGGGAVGRRKVQGLLAADAAVRVVDPVGGDWPEGVERIAEPYAPAHLAGAALVFACTDDPATNARIAADARDVGAWVNVADSPDLCDFTVPAVHADDAITLAVATHGHTPALAKAVRDILADLLGEDLPAFAEALADLRRDLHAKCPDPRQRQAIMRHLAGPDGQAAFRRGGAEALAALAEQVPTEDGPAMDGG